MGLDMYFTAQKFVAGGYDHKKGTPEEKQFNDILGILGIPREVAGSSITVNIQVGYLRKANAIHAWLVDNIQEGEDKCQEAYFPTEQITELRDICRRILATVDKGEPVTVKPKFGTGSWEEYPNLKLDKNLAESLLETREGFFFGSYEYDEGYVYDLETAEKFLTNMLENPALKGMDFYYQASW